MCLSNNNVLSEEDINQWIWDLRATWGYIRPITLVLDVCRTNKGIEPMKVHRGANLICSSSLGQKAPAIRFKSNQDMPYSSFMLAYLIASRTSLTRMNPQFLADIEYHLRQLTALTSLIASKTGGEDLGCQEPDWSRAVVRT
jgi:hypothetical protein